MFKVVAKKSHELCCKKTDTNFNPKWREQEFNQFRILKKLGFHFRIKIIKNWKGERRREFELHPGECNERFVNDTRDLPEVLWDYFTDYQYGSILKIKRIKPLLLQKPDGYSTDVISLKDLVTTPQVRIDHGLIQFNQVDVLEDCCTEHLMKMLDDGWRIISCLPQPSQRRPDYIIGRIKDV